MQRLRITFSKLGVARYIGNLDLHKGWERALRRAGLPLAYSMGFHPQAKIQLASALPLGCTSEAEIVDIWLNADMETDAVLCALLEVIGPGIEIMSIVEVMLSEKSLQSRLVAAEYEASMDEEVPDGELDELVQQFLAAEEIVRVRRGKEYNLRPLVQEMEVKAKTGENRALRMLLAARPGATGRPEEVLTVLGLPVRLLHRTGLRFC